MGWKDSRAGSTIEEIGFGLQTPLIQPPPNPAPKTSMRIKRASDRCYPRLESALAVRHEESEKLPRLPVERPEGRAAVQLLHRSFQIFAQLLTQLVPKSTRHSLAVADSPAVGRASKPADFADLRGDFIQLLFRKTSKAAVEELDFPAEIPLQEPRPRMGLLIGSDMVQKRKLPFDEIGNSCLPKWEVC